MGLFRLGFHNQQRSLLLHFVPEAFNKNIKHSALLYSRRSKLVIAKALSTEAVAAAQPTKMVKAIRVHEFGGPEVVFSPF